MSFSYEFDCIFQGFDEFMARVHKPYKDALSSPVI